MAGGLKTARKSQMSFPGDTGSDIKKQDIKPVILQAELCLKKFEEYPELLADDDAILESLKEVMDKNASKMFRRYLQKGVSRVQVFSGKSKTL